MRRTNQRPHHDEEACNSTTPASNSSALTIAIRAQPCESPAAPNENLKIRELEVFQMTGEGKPTRQIAEELELTIPTIHSYRNRIKDKLQLKNATELMLHAMQWVRERTAS